MKLLRLVERSKKRRGRGHGSGRGKTAGRGTKGQNARGKMPPHFEGGQLSVMKRLPFLRGKLRNKSRNEKPVTILVGALSVFPKDADITLESLLKHGLINIHESHVKILAGGKLSEALHVTVPCSSGAKKTIEKAGGNVS